MKVGASIHRPSFSLSALVCFIIATSIWLFSSLNERYTYHLALPLTIETSAGFSWTEPPPAQLELQLEASGWNLIRISIIRPTIHFSAAELRESTVLDTHIFMRHIQTQLPGAAVVENANPAFIPLQTEAMMERKVPVWLALDVPDGYQLSSEYFQLRPDSITITGPAAEVSTITSCGTENLVIPASEGIHEGKAPLVYRKDLQYSAIVIAYKVELLPIDTAQ